MMKILCVGEEWRGSNASGLFYALSRQGAVVQVVNEQKYVSTAGDSLVAKAANRAIRHLQVSDYNQQLKKAIDSFQPDILFVYKGTFVHSDVLLYCKKASRPVVNFFPDVSFLAHGTLIPSCIPHYDHIFTTKTFAADDLAQNFNFSKSRVSFIPHGFDPSVHRTIQVPAGSNFHCDASFIGNFSRHKSDYLAHLAQQKEIKIRIWGGTWQVAPPVLQSAIQGTSISGDLYAMAINASKINIALLSERVTGASRGDQITSRTFHIPGAGGFMLHQRTDEVKEYFKEDVEMACFSSKEELMDKVMFYLQHETSRLLIARRGYERANAFHSLDQRAVQVMDILRREFSI